MRPEPDMILYRDLTDVYGVDFSPNGSLLASAHSDGSVRVCYPEIDEELWNFETEFQPLVVRFSPDGRLLAAGAFDRTLYVLDVSSGKVKEITTNFQNTSVRFSPLSHLLASVETSSGNCNFWDLESGEYMGGLGFYGDPVADFNFSSDGTLLAVCQGSEVQIWDAVREGLLRWFHGHETAVKVASFSPDGRHVASADSDGTVILWNVHMLTTVWSSQAGSSALSLAFDHSGKSVAVAFGDGTVRIFDVRTGDLLTTPLVPGDIFELTFSRVNGSLAIAGIEFLQIWYDSSKQVGSDRFLGATAEGWIKPRYAR